MQKFNGSFDDDLFFFTPNKKDFLKDVHTYVPVCFWEFLRR